MKLVLIGPTAPNFKGGIVHYTYRLFKELEQVQKDSFLVSFRRSYPKTFFPGGSVGDTSRDLYRVKDELCLIDWANPFSWIATWLAIKRMKPNRVIFQWWTWFWGLPYLVIMALLKLTTNSRLVVVAHNPTDHEQAVYKSVLSRRVFKMADSVVVHSLAMKEKMEADKQKVVMTLHPIYDLFDLKKAKASRLETRPPRLLFFGHVREYKGLDILIKALEKLWQKGADVSLLIAGEFWEPKADYLKLVSQTNRHRVQIIDRYLKNEEVADIFKACEAVVIPYRTGTGSGPSKIALHYRKPLIATPVADNPDLFKVAKPGIMVQKADPESFARGISLFLKKPKGYYNKEIEKLRKSLSWRKLAETLIKA